MNTANKITAHSAGWRTGSLPRSTGFRYRERIAPWGHAPLRGSRHQPGVCEITIVGCLTTTVLCSHAKKQNQR
jgi:hypothetical protein